MHRSLSIALASLVGSALAAPALAAPPPPPPHATHPVAGRLTVDSSIGALMDNPATRRIMDRHLPNLSSNPHYFMIKGHTLRQLAPMGGGKLTDAALAKIAAELAAAQA